MLEQLQQVPAVTCRSMFGGFGLYSGASFFGIIADHQLFFKTDAATRSAYLAAGTGYFQPTPKQALKNYYAVPADVLEDQTLLVQWANTAIDVARRDGGA